MKKFLHTTILAVIIFLSFSANAKSKLSISTTMPTAIKVVIDGRKFYSQDNRLSINNLQPGYHNITIYYIKNGKDFNNFYNNGNNSYWKKAVSRQVAVKNNYLYDITINRFGRAFYDQDVYYRNDNSYGWRSNGNNNQDHDSNYDSDEEDNSYINNNFDFNNGGYSEDYDDWSYFKKQPITDNTKNNTNNSLGSTGNNYEYYNNDNNRNDYKTYNQSMSNKMFDDLKQTIQQTNFESSKLNLAKQSIDKYSINTYQVKEILNMLSMEFDKLDFAKYAYNKTRDANNYFTVANSFQMQSSKDELLKYIKNK